MKGPVSYVRLLHVSQNSGCRTHEWSRTRSTEPVLSITHACTAHNMYTTGVVTASLISRRLNRPDFPSPTLTVSYPRRWDTVAQRLSTSAWQTRESIQNSWSNEQERHSGKCWRLCVCERSHLRARMASSPGSHPRHSQSPARCASNGEYCDSKQGAYRLRHCSSRPCQWDRPGRNCRDYIYIPKTPLNNIPVVSRAPLEPTSGSPDGPHHADRYGIRGLSCYTAFVDTKPDGTFGCWWEEYP